MELMVMCPRFAVSPVVLDFAISRMLGVVTSCVPTSSCGDVTGSGSCGGSGEIFCSWLLALRGTNRGALFGLLPVM